jgi:hypothetical protein
MAAAALSLMISTAVPPPGVLDRLDVEQNSLGFVVQRKIVKEIGDIDIELIADRYDSGKSDRALRAAQSTMPAAMAPDCEISASFPLPGMCAEKLALRFAPGIMMPRQFGPISRIRYFCAARSAASACDPAPWPRPALTMTAPAAPRRPASSTSPATAPAGAVMTTNSGANGNVEAGDAGEIVDLGVTRIHQSEFAVEFRFLNIVENGPADRAASRTCAHEGHRTGRK